MIKLVILYTITIMFFYAGVDIEIVNDIKSKNTYVKTKAIDRESINKDVYNVWQEVYKHHWLEDLDITIKFTTHKYKGMTGLAKRFKKKHKYTIYIMSSHRSVNTFYHEIGHIFRWRYINLGKYHKHKSYKPKSRSWYWSLEEDFAEDFKYFFTGEKKRTFYKYNKNFEYLIKLFADDIEGLEFDFLDNFIKDLEAKVNDDLTLQLKITVGGEQEFSLILESIDLNDLQISREEDIWNPGIIKRYKYLLRGLKLNTQGVSGIRLEGDVHLDYDTERDILVVKEKVDESR